MAVRACSGEEAGGCPDPLELRQGVGGRREEGGRGAGEGVGSGFRRRLSSLLEGSRAGGGRGLLGGSRIGGGRGGEAGRSSCGARGRGRVRVVE